MVVSGMRKHYMVEVGLWGNSLHIEANDQTEAIRLAKDAVLEDGLLIFAQRMDKGERAEDEAPERTSVIWRPGHEWSDQKKHVANRNVTGNGIRPMVSTMLPMKNRRARKCIILHVPIGTS